MYFISVIGLVMAVVLANVDAQLEHFAKNLLAVSSADQLALFQHRVRVSAMERTQVSAGIPNDKAEAACKKAVDYAKAKGASKHPSWFQGLTDASDDGDFKAFFAAKRMFSCSETMTPCTAQAMWAQRIGMKNDPSWYPGLDESSSLEDFKDFFASCNRYGCQQEAMENCKAAVFSAMSEGIKDNPDQYPGLNRYSTFDEFKAILAEGHQEGCHIEQQADCCMKTAEWAKATGVIAKPEWYPDLTSDSAVEDFKDFFATQGRHGCDGGSVAEVARESEHVDPETVANATTESLVSMLDEEDPNPEPVPEQVDDEEASLAFTQEGSGTAAAAEEEASLAEPSEVPLLVTEPAEVPLQKDLDFAEWQQHVLGTEQALASDSQEHGFDGHSTLPVGATAPFTELGFQKVAATNDDKEMADFVQRIMAATGMTVLWEEGFHRFVKYYNSKIADKSLDAMITEMRSAEWVAPVVPGTGFRDEAHNIVLVDQCNNTNVPEKDEEGKDWFDDNLFCHRYDCHTREALMMQGYIMSRPHPTCPMRTQYQFKDEYFDGCQQIHVLDSDETNSELSRPASFTGDFGLGLPEWFGWEEYCSLLLVNDLDCYSEEHEWRPNPDCPILLQYRVSWL